MAYGANTNFDNEEKYLNNLAAQGGGNAAWAQNQLKELNRAREQYGGSSVSTTGSVSSDRSDGYDSRNKPIYSDGAKPSVYQDYSRRPDLAGSMQLQGGMAIYYDKDGYMEKAVNINDPDKFDGAWQAIQDLNAAGISTAHDFDLAERGLSAGGAQNGTQQSAYGGSAANELMNSIKAQMANRPQYSSMDDYAGAMGYDENKRYIQDAIKASVEQAIMGYQKQIADTERSAEEAARQAFIAKKLGERNLDQKLAAGGYAGGAADSQRIAQETNYQNQLSQMNRMKEDTIAEIQRAIEASKLSGNLQEAQQLQELMMQLQTQWQGYVDNWVAQNNENVRYLQQLGLQQDQMQYEREQTQRADAYNRAMTSIAAGIMPGAEELAAAGITTDTARGFLGWETPGAQLPANQTVDQPRVPGYNNGGLTSEQIRNLQQYYGLMPDGYWGPQSKSTTGMDAVSAWNEMQSAAKTGANYSNIKRTITSLMESGQQNRAIDVMSQYWGSMTPQQQKEMQTALAAYGVRYQP